MKKLLFISCLVWALIGCTNNDNDDNGGTPEKAPIDNLEMPSSQIPVKGGFPITIGGEGFLRNSEIYLREVASENSGAKATITEITDASLTFIAPETINGVKEVILLMNKKEYILGLLTFTGLTETLYGLIENSDYGYDIGEINLDNDIYQLIYRGGENQIGGVVACGNKLFFSKYMDKRNESSLYSYDLGSQKATLLSNHGYVQGDEENIALVVIDFQLYGIKHTTTKGFYLVSIDMVSGQETEKYTFGKYTSKQNEDFYSYDGKAIYDPATNAIFLAGGGLHSDANDLYPKDFPIFIALYLDNSSLKSIIPSPTAKPVTYTYSCTFMNQEIAFFQEVKKDNSSVSIYGILDPTTLEVANLNTFEHEFRSPVFLKSKQIFIGLGDSKDGHLKSYSIRTLEMKDLLSQTSCWEVFIGYK